MNDDTPKVLRVGDTMRWSLALIVQAVRDSGHDGTTMLVRVTDIREGENGEKVVWMERA